jgi:DNA-binding XRE family transcriptional regulator
MEGLTLEEMSERSGISKRHLIDIEYGRVNPHFLTLLGLAQALERDIIDLLKQVFQEPEMLEEFLTKVRNRAVGGLVEINVPRYAQEMGLSPSTIKRLPQKAQDPRPPQPLSP